jgi:hypothetical protein
MAEAVAAAAAAAAADVVSVVMPVLQLRAVARMSASPRSLRRPQGCLPVLSSRSELSFPFLNDASELNGNPPQLSAYDDGSTDNSPKILSAWKPRLAALGIRTVLSKPIPLSVQPGKIEEEEEEERRRRTRTKNKKGRTTIFTILLNFFFFFFFFPP